MRRIAIIGLLLLLALALVTTANAARTIYGTSVDDYIVGTADKDTIWGFEGDDWLFGKANTDELKGGRGADRLIGGTSSDNLWGNNGPDRLDGGSHIDWLQGGYQDDVITAWHDYARDHVDGGPGVDSCYLDAGDALEDVSCEYVYISW